MKRGGTRAALVSPEQCADAPRRGRATERPCLSGLGVSLSDPLQMGRGSHQPGGGLSL